MPRHHSTLPILALLGASMLWGLSWLPLKGLHALGIDGIVLILTTYGLLALLFTPALWRARHTLGRANARPLLLIALLGGGANIAFTSALIHGEVIRVMVLFYLLPAWSVLGGRIFLHERVDGARWLGVGLALTGAFLILGGFDALGGPPSWNDLIALSAGLLLAMTNLVFRAARAEPMVAKVGAMFYGCVLLAALLLLTGVEAWPVAVSGTAWGAIALYACGWLLFANLGAQYGVTHLEAGRASIILLMELLAAVVSASLIGGERMDGWELFGGALILAAALLEALRDLKSPPYEIGAGAA
ncbi:MAG: DMT family transporter [Gammaproteobacteria bacterium]|nr:DMT family transporter [Gammaproteobacteria bacterium]